MQDEFNKKGTHITPNAKGEKDLPDPDWLPKKPKKQTKSEDCSPSSTKSQKQDLTMPQQFVKRPKIPVKPLKYELNFNWST